MKRALAAALALLLGFAFGFAAGARAEDTGPPDVPPGPGRIEGRVVRSESGAPVAHAEVALYALGADGLPGLRKTTSDADGRFAFEGVATDPAVAYLAGAKVDEIPYPGGRLAFHPGEDTLRTEIRVAEVTRDPRDLRMGEVTLRLSRESAGIRVVETTQLENTGTRTYFVAAGERATARPALRARLPAGATRFEMPLGVIPEGLARAGDALAYYGPIHPGPHEISWSYLLPADAASESVSLAFTPAEGAARVVVLVPEGAGRITGGDFAAGEAVEVEGRRFASAEAKAPRGALRVALALPPPKLAPGSVSVSQVELVLHVDDAAVDVREIHSLHVASDAPVLGTPEQPLLAIELPPAAVDLRYGSDAADVALVPRAEGGLAALGTLAPGDARVELAYRLPASGDAAEVTRRFASRLPLLSVYVADSGDLALASNRLHRRRPVATNDLTYQQLEGFEIAAGEEVKLTIGRLPARARAAGPRGAAAAAAVVALAALAVLIGPLRARGERAAEEETSSAERDEREAVYASLRDLDHDRETGKLSDADYEALRGELRARAAALLRAEREREALPAPRARGSHCTSCGAEAKPEHRFCAQCGKPLAA